MHIVYLPEHGTNDVTPAAAALHHHLIEAEKKQGKDERRGLFPTQDSHLGNMVLLGGSFSPPARRLGPHAGLVDEREGGRHNSRHREATQR